MSNKEIGLAPHHIPTITAREYNLSAHIENDLNNGQKQEIKFNVAGYNTTIPQNEILTVYPPIDHIGNFAGTFPHIQFRRSTLPWEYEVKNGTDRLPYIFLVLLEEEELKNNVNITSNTNQPSGSTKSLTEQKPLKVITCNNSDLLPKPDLIPKLAHVRVQEHAELKDLSLPKETSILVSHRMVKPNKKYRAFVCYYAEENSGKYEMIQDLNKISNTCVVLNEWSFESIGAELYQIDSNKLENHPKFDSFKNNLKDSNIITLDKIKSSANTELRELIEKNEQYLTDRKQRWEKWPNKNTIKEFEQEERNYVDNNFIIEYLEYNGENLKGYLHELELQPFKTKQYNNLLDEEIQKLLNLSKIPLEHQLKAGGKMVSWYQGPFTDINTNNTFDLLNLLAQQNITDVPYHQDYLNLFNEGTGMYDMTYSAAWQLGRIMIMNDNKVLQELKKWKYELELYQLVLEQNKLSHLPNLSIQEPSIPDVLMNYVTELVQFRNFPLYYLLPHADLSTEETIKHFKIDNSWILAFLFGIFSAGPKLSLEDFEYYLFILPKTRLKELYPTIKDNVESFLENLESNTDKILQSHSSALENDAVIIDQIKKELWYVFNYKKEYNGILLQSQTIKNWPHLIVELDESHDFHYVTTINNTLRLYITDKPFTKIDMYLKNENAHFGMDYKDNKVKTISVSANEDSATTANNYLYKQPRVMFKIQK